MPVKDSLNFPTMTHFKTHLERVVPDHKHRHRQIMDSFYHFSYGVRGAPVPVIQDFIPLHPRYLETYYKHIILTCGFNLTFCSFRFTSAFLVSNIFMLTAWDLKWSLFRVSSLILATPIAASR